MTVSRTLLHLAKEFASQIMRPRSIRWNNIWNIWKISLYSLKLIAMYLLPYEYVLMNQTKTGLTKYVYSIFTKRVTCQNQLLSLIDWIIWWFSTYENITDSSTIKYSSTTFSQLINLSTYMCTYVAVKYLAILGKWPLFS